MVSVSADIMLSALPDVRPRTVRYRQFELFVLEHDAIEYLATQKLQSSAELG